MSHQESDRVAILTITLGAPLGKFRNGFLNISENSKWFSSFKLDYYTDGDLHTETGFMLDGSKIKPKKNEIMFAIKSLLSSNAFDHWFTENGKKFREKGTITRWNFEEKFGHGKGKVIFNCLVDGGYLVKISHMHVAFSPELSHEMNEVKTFLEERGILRNLGVNISDILEFLKCFRNEGTYIILKPRRMSHAVKKRQVKKSSKQ